jgi:hypothetical protein
MKPSPSDLQQVAYEKAIIKAETEIPIIERLLDSDGWKWLQARLEAEAAPIVDRILSDDSLTDAETHILRRVLRTLKEVSQLPASDLARHRQYLASQAKMNGDTY